MVLDNPYQARGTMLVSQPRQMLENNNITTGGKSSAPAPKGGLAGADDFPSGPWSTLEYPGGPRPRAGPPGPRIVVFFGPKIGPPWGAPIDH